MILHERWVATSTAQLTGLCERPALIQQTIMLQVAELQRNYSDWLSQQAGEQDAAHEMQRALREAQGDSQALRHKLSAAQQQHSRAEAKYHSKVGWPAQVALSGRPPMGTCWWWTLRCGLPAKQAWLQCRGSAALKMLSI